MAALAAPQQVVCWRVTRPPFALRFTRSVMTKAAFRQPVVNRFSPFVAQFSSEEIGGDRELGTVKWFDPSKGFGFLVRDSGEDLFVHFTSIRGDGFRTLEEGQRVAFTEGVGQKGPMAENVEVQ